MDGTEDSSYLTLLNDGTHNYLLQTTDDGLGVQDASLNVEPIFTEIEDGSGAWSVGLPILMNADQALETPIVMPTAANIVDSVIDLPTSLPELYENSLENRVATSETNHVQYPIEIPGKGFITADGLFIANDLLLQLKLGNESLDIPNQPKSANNETMPKNLDQEDMLINPKTLIPHENNDLEPVESVEYEQSMSNKVVQPRTIYNNSNREMESVHLINECIDINVSNLEEPNNVIRLLNNDGTIIDINKEQFLNYNVSDDKLEDDRKSLNTSKTAYDVFEIVMAHKCRQCSSLYENRDDMMQHWKIEHSFHKNKVQITNGEVPSLKESAIKEIKEQNSLKLFNGEIRMKSILKGNDHQTVYLCSQCNVGYGSTEKLKNHMITAHKLAQRPDGNAEMINGIKNNGTRPKLTAAIIQKQAKAAKKIKCSVKGCDLRFAKDEMRIRHEKCHVEGQKKQFKCFECDNKFSIWRVCSMHMWKCHNIDLGLLTCPMCSVFKASCAVRLITHMAIHSEEKPYLCNDCGKTFKQHTQLRNHQVIHKNPDNVSALTNQQQCEICKKFFANSKSLKKHIKSVHDKYKPFICNICGHTAARKAMLELHLRQHTGEKPHKCPLCEYKTGDHNSLRRHVMRHSGDTKYACPHCNYSSIQSTSYKKHIASKHPGLGGSFFCYLCSYHTVNEDAYRKHRADHRNGLIKDAYDNNGTKDVLNKAIASLKDEEMLINGDHRCKNKDLKDDDDEMQSYLLSMDHSNDAIDTGGITIPAGFELQVPL